MLTIVEALQWIDDRLGTADRARHSTFVGHAMRSLAEIVGADALLWELTGLCHDLDFYAVAGDWSRHGIVAAEWLKDELPDDALLAIRSHDHRTGITCDRPICRALKLTDALAIVTYTLGSETSAVLQSRNAADQLATRFAARPYLVSLLVGNAEALGVPLTQLASILRHAPPTS